MIVLVMNSGSSSLKFQLINMDNGEVMSKGLVERIGMGGDASSWGVMFQSGGPFNLAQYENPELDALFDEAAVLTDSAERKALYDQAFQIIEDEAAWVPLLYTTIVHVSTKDLNLSRGLEVGDNNLQPFYVTVN